VLLGDLSHHAFRDPRAVSQTRKMQLPHFSASAHVVHQVKSISFAANESHETHPVTSMPVVYCTSTTRCNVCFILPREIASKALTLLSRVTLIALKFVFPTRKFASGVKDTRPGPALFITFLAPFHLRNASSLFFALSLLLA
jgi:hypothetical protein